ncbi:MAG: phosphoglucosamine mutase [Alphaproteobacteria bacterium]|jgi:phosphoglucosamine mutase|nr:phosphoglucosamine mutase [Alphaproteobacteria bacterium]MBT7221197.1 phosphoglucosamine mutase [Alphaproteobacteria bacterium]|tara:strand:- start:4203 stop:5552 length:1350 start_codon:yes stop_codon:yes gene_type:complete
MAGIFGTDGVRARINTGPMRAEAVVRLALAAGRWFADQSGEQHTSTAPTVVIGKDTRLSGYMIESALVAGFTSIGINCRLLGPVPTAAVSYLTHSMRAEFGVMISASHNPHHDNGIKLFGPDGMKLDDAIEEGISSLMQGSIALSDPSQLGRARRMVNSAQRYMEFAKSTFDTAQSLTGLRVVIDCAHGAAYNTAPNTLHELGAEIVSMGVAPDGLNINEDCGATAPDAMAQTVREASAQIGIGLDGDADRLILSDETGGIFNGDYILAALALDMQANGLLHGPVVGTVMSNLGLELLLAEKGIAFERAAVGDRYVLERMKTTGSNLGGEPSGHILLPHLTRSGDGLIAALQILGVMCRTGKTASELLNQFVPVPQKLVNLPDIDKSVLKEASIIQTVAAVEAELGNNGRVILRPSGTEPLIRVMVEALDEPALDKAMEKLVTAIESYR